ncbi:hypothetical protein CR513_24566, partial [Mucuna pruriens]
MKSFSISCDHILVVLMYLIVSDFPKCLVLKRWTNVAKDMVKVIEHVEIFDDFIDERREILDQLVRSKDDLSQSNELTQNVNQVIRNPIIIRSKGRHVYCDSWSRGSKTKKNIRCTPAKKLVTIGELAQHV